MDPGLDERTIVRYCIRYVERSFLSGCPPGLLRGSPRATVVFVHRRLARPAFEILGRGAGRAAQARRLRGIDAGPAAGGGKQFFSSAAARVARLKLAGFVESTPDRRLAPTRNFFQRPLAEAPVHAGLPNPIDDGPADALTLDDYLIEHPSRTVLVRVKGDSMIDAGVLDGDLVVVEKRAGARRGEIVVAIVDNQFTLKRLDLERGRFILRPENKAYPIIRPEGTLEIFGVMVGLVRKIA